VAARARSRHISDKSRFRKREGVITSDDDVVKDADVNERKCITQAARDQLIGMARLRNTGRMHVGEYYGSGIELEHFANDFSWMHARSVNGASKQLLDRDYRMSRREKEDCEGFEGTIAKALN
jgi:hypothetical protein